MRAGHLETELPVVETRIAEDLKTRIVDGRLTGADPDTPVTGSVEFDSRAIGPGGLFVALPGERVTVEITELHRARLALCVAARQVLANGLGMLGVSAPERM